MIGKEDVQLSGKQIDELIDLIGKEEFLENEEKIEKALQKSKEERELLHQQKEHQKQVDSNENLVDNAANLIEKTDDAKHILQEKNNVSEMMKRNVT